MDFQGLDVNKLYSTLAKIIGQRENISIKFTLERREKR